MKTRETLSERIARKQAEQEAQKQEARTQVEIRQSNRRFVSSKITSR